MANHEGDDEVQRFNDFWQGVCHAFLFFDPRHRIWEFVFVWRLGVHIFYSRQEVYRFLHAQADTLRTEFGDRISFEEVATVITDLPEIDDGHRTVNLDSHAAILAFMALGEKMDDSEDETADAKSNKGKGRTNVFLA